MEGGEGSVKRKKMGMEGNLLFHFQSACVHEVCRKSFKKGKIEDEVTKHWLPNSPRISGKMLL